MRKSIVDRDILPAFENRQLNEITADDLRALCNKMKVCVATATAVHVRDIVKQVYAFAMLHGKRVDSPAVAHQAVKRTSWTSETSSDGRLPTLMLYLIPVTPSGGK